MNMCNINNSLKYFFTTGLLLSFIFISAQENKKDSTQPHQQNDSFFLAKKKGLLGKLGKSLVINASVPADSIIATKENIASFKQYANKPIRKIYFTKIDYGQSIYDTTKSIKNFLTKAANKLHTPTRQAIIEKNLFFNEKTKLNPYLVADNETYLRTIPYLQDARIIVTKPLDKTSGDSVDIDILYKDVFPVGGSIVSADNQNIFLEGNDENILGYGDRIQAQVFSDLTRTPTAGWGAEYVKRNIAGSFVDATMGYENLARAFNNGRRQEDNLYLKLDLPLVHPNRFLTGGLEASRHFTRNDYQSDSLYNSTYKYDYNYLDIWVGFNISREKETAENKSRTVKKFITLRASTTDFKTVPDKYLHQYNYQYANINSFLASFTVFKQNFFHTPFIYGFGRNEDIPKGYNISFIGGVTNKQNFVRPYYGMNVEANFFGKRENYYDIIYRLGSYYHDNSFEDISFLTSIETFTRLRKLGNSRWLVRHFVTGSITQQIRTKLNQPLILNSEYGLQDFKNPDTLGSTRATLNLQTVFYNTWKFVGFSFAPFTFANMCYVKNIGVKIFNGNLYTEWGVGVRSRNESLVFGTMEFRFSYYPRTVQNMMQWGVSFNTNLSFKYNSQYVQRPDFVEVN